MSLSSTAPKRAVLSLAAVTVVATVAAVGSGIAWLTVVKAVVDAPPFWPMTTTVGVSCCSLVIIVSG